MENIFYSLGILYFIVSYYNFISYDHKRDVCLGAKNNILDLTESQDYCKPKKSDKYYPRQLLGVLFFIWNYVGYVSDFPEKDFFLFNLFLLITHFLFLIYLGFALAVNYTNFIMNRINFSNKKVPKKLHLPISKIVYFIEFLSVSGILALHYLIS